MTTKLLVFPIRARNKQEIDRQLFVFEMFGVDGAGTYDRTNHLLSRRTKEIGLDFVLADPAYVGGNRPLLGANYYLGGWRNINQLFVDEEVPLLVTTNDATFEDLDSALNPLTEMFVPNITLMHSITAENENLSRLRELADYFNPLKVGVIASTSAPYYIVASSVLYGASVIMLDFFSDNIDVVYLSNLKRAINHFEKARF